MLDGSAFQPASQPATTLEFLREVKVPLEGEDDCKKTNNPTGMHEEFQAVNGAQGRRTRSGLGFGHSSGPQRINQTSLMNIEVSNCSSIPFNGLSVRVAKTIILITVQTQLV